MIKQGIPFLLSLLLSTCTYSVLAQVKTDTLVMDIKSAEKIFLENNIPLLVEKLNISQADARILQAKVWPNPIFTLDEIQVYRNSTTDAIPALIGNFWRDRNFAMQVEQLILTAGKRKKNITLEVRSKEMAEITFSDLLLALKAEFRQHIATIMYLQNIRGSWQTQLGEVEKLVKSQSGQFAGGHISEAELFRLKALQISLTGEINAMAEQMAAQQKNLKNLMYLDAQHHLVISDDFDTSVTTLIRNRTLEEILQLSEHNTMLRAAQGQVRLQEAVLDIEIAKRIPDLTLSSNYDRNGSTMRNFLGLGLSMPIPVFDKNKGYIQVARYEVEKSNLQKKNLASEIKNSIVQHWSDLNQSIILYESIDKNYIDKLNGMTKAISRNFAEHNINLLEFLDFYNAFRESKEKYYEAIKNILIKKEDLNYLVGGEL